MILTTSDSATERVEQADVVSFVGSTLHEPILRVLIYYDLFLYPLTSREIFLFLDVADVLPEDVEECLAALRNEGAVDCSEGYWYLCNRGSEIVTRRLAMEMRGADMWKIARRIGRLMKMTPYIRGIFISGQLSRYIADEQSDIDYFIVTEPGRLWIVRTFFVLCRRTLFLNSRKYFCTNYFITTDNLSIRERNVYTACETAALKPLWNRDIFRRIVANNRWLSDFYPNFSFSDVSFREGTGERRSRIQWLLEGIIPKRLATRLDGWLMEATRKYWHHKFPECPEKRHETSFRCTPNESRAHPDDQSIVVLSRYRRALALHGVAGSESSNESHSASHL